MIPKIKDILGKYSVIELTLIKIVLSSFIFLLIFVLIYSHNYWEKQKVKLNYLLLNLALEIQTEIESQISLIEDIKGNQNLTASEITLRVQNIIKPIIYSNNINSDHHDYINRSNNNSNFTGYVNLGNNNKISSIAVLYYDLELDTIVRNQNGLLFDESYLQELLGSNIGDLTINDLVGIKMPVYYQNEIAGYIIILAEEANFLVISFNETTLVIILGLILAIMIMIIVRKNMQQIQLYLSKFCGIIIKQENQDDQEGILLKLPELEPVLKRITAYTDDLKKVNQQLDLSRSRINKILEGISDGFYMLDDNWQFEFINNSTMKLMCPENGELLGKNIWEVLPGLRNTLSWNKMHQALVRKEYVQWEAEGFVDSAKFYEYRAYPLKDGLTVFFRDITEFRRQKQEYDRLERLNLVGQLAAGISHEIRNPMTTIRGFLQMFGEKSRYEQDKGNIDLMISEIDRANTIITDFLSLAKGNLDNDKPYNINETIEKILPMLQANAYNNNKEVVTDLAPIPDIIINENEIIQLVLNLVRNGLDVTPENNKVIISTYLAEDKVVLAVKDHGTGIAEEYRNKIGTPFFTTKETGTGLGLATSMSIAQRHKALFRFETGEEGTVFYTIFPVCSEKRVKIKAEKAKSGISGHRFGKHNIMSQEQPNSVNKISQEQPNSAKESQVLCYQSRT